MIPGLGAFGLIIGAGRVVEIAVRQAIGHRVRICPVFVERAVQPERFDNHVVHEITIRLAGCLCRDHAGEDVVGVRIMVAFALRQVAASGRIDEVYQVFGTQLARGIVDPYAGHGFGLGVVRDAARHVEETLDRHILPRRILRKPFAKRVVDGQLARSLELQDQAAVKDFDVLPIWNSVPCRTGASCGPLPIFPANASIAGPVSPKLT